MPPSTPTPQGTIRYLTHLIAAMAREHGGELRISRAILRQIEDDTSKNSLLEGLDSDNDEIVLRFGPTPSAIYPIEPKGEPTLRTQQTETPVTLHPAPTPSSVPSSGMPQSSLPFTDEQLASAEAKINRMRMLNRIRRERPQA